MPAFRRPQRGSCRGCASHQHGLNSPGGDTASVDRPCVDGATRDRRRLLHQRREFPSPEDQVHPWGEAQVVGVLIQELQRPHRPSVPGFVQSRRPQRDGAHGPDQAGDCVPLGQPGCAWQRACEAADRARESEFERGPQEATRGPVQRLHDAVGPRARAVRQRGSEQAYDGLGFLRS